MNEKSEAPDTRMLVSEHVDGIGWELDGKTLTEAVEFLKGMAETYPDAKLDFTEHNYSEHYDLWIVTRRYETDEEVQARLHADKEAAKRQLEHERQQYLRLKAKFGDKE